MRHFFTLYGLALIAGICHGIYSELKTYNTLGIASKIFITILLTVQIWLIYALIYIIRN